MFFRLLLLSMKAELLIHNNILTGPVPDSLCELRSEYEDFKLFHADCFPFLNVAQNPCAFGCCTDCF